MHRIRQHLTYANVMVTILAFIVLGGGSAVALSGSNTVFSDDIVDNEVKTADVRNDTLSGGGLGAADLQPNSVGTSEAANNSLTGTDVNESSLTGDAQHLIWAVAAGNPATTIGTVGPYTIKGHCAGGSPGGTSLDIFVRGPAGTEDTLWNQTRNDSTDEGTHSSGLLIPANTDLLILDLFPQTTNDFTRAGGTSMLRTGSVLVQVDFDAVADARNAGSCFVYGTATRAT